MSLAREFYGVTPPRDFSKAALEATIVELNQRLADIDERFTRIQGADGVFTADVDASGVTISAGDPTKDTHVVTKGWLRRNSVVADEGGDLITERVLVAKEGIRVGKGAKRKDDVITLGDVQQVLFVSLTAAAANDAPPKVTDASDVGTVTTQFALEDHTHQGVNLDASQTITGTKTFNTGGAPFAVGSTTKVTNLNADLLDGLDSTAFVLVGATAGGDLSGTYPNPSVVDDSHNHAIATSITGLGANVATFLGTPSSANLAAAVMGETGTGALVFGTSPTFTTQITCPLIYGGAASANTLDLYANDETFALANTGRIRLGERVTIALSASTSSSFLDNLITDTSTITTSHNTFAYSGFKFSVQVNYSTSLAVAIAPAFWANASFRPTTSVADTAGTVTYAGFFATPRWEPNTAAITPTGASLVGYLSGPKAKLLTGTSGTMTRMTAFASFAYASYDGLAPFDPNVTANITITTLRGFHHGDPSSAGTVTTHIGVDVEAITVGTTKIGIRNASTTVYTPTTAQVIDAAGDTILANATVVLITNTTGGAITVTSTPTIADGQNGQLLYIINTGTNDITLRDQSAIASNLRLAGAANLTLGRNDSVTFVFSSAIGDWVQVGASNN